MHAIEGGNNVPAFLTKLWRLVEDESNNDLISWTMSGRSFVIQNQARFSRDLLPQYYKHNNMASFVRQLNMYGFHKVVSADSGGLRVERDEMEFAHPHFLRGQENLLENIKRKQQRRLPSDGVVFTQIPTGRTLVVEDNKNVTKLLSDVRDMKRDQDTMNNKLITLKRENEALWREYANMRQKFTKQQQIIEKLIHFLIAMVKSPSKGLVPKRKFSHLALEGGDETTPSLSKINTMHQFLQGNSIEVLEQTDSSSGGAQIQEVTEEPDLMQVVPPHPPPITTTTTTTTTTTPAAAAPGNIISREHQQQHQHQQQQQHQHVVSESEPLEILGLNDEPSEYIDIISTDHINASNVVSPDGTVMMVGETSHPLLDDAPLSPELYNVVDPSVVTQSFIYPAAPPPPPPAASPNSNNNNTTTTTTTTTTTATATTINTNTDPITASFLVSSGDRNAASTSTSSVVPTHKSAGGKRPQTVTGAAAASPQRRGKNTTTTNTTTTEPTEHTAMRVAVPDKTIKNRHDLQNHVDDMQTTIDNLQDFLSTANLNVDPSMIHSVFGIDNYLPELDSMATVSSGNELSIYNPNLLDLASSIEDDNDEDNDPFSFLNDSIPSTSANTPQLNTPVPSNKTPRPPPPKHLKVTIKKEVDSSSLETPVISPAVTSTPIFSRGKRQAN